MSYSRIGNIKYIMNETNKLHNVDLTYKDYGEYKLLILNGSIISKPIKSLRELEKACFLVSKVLQNIK